MTLKLDLFDLFACTQLGSTTKNANGQLTSGSQSHIMRCLFGVHLRSLHQRRSRLPELRQGGCGEFEQAVAHRSEHAFKLQKRKSHLSS